MSPSPMFAYSAANRKATGYVVPAGIEEFTYAGKNYALAGITSWGVYVVSSSRAYVSDNDTNRVYNLNIASPFDISTVTVGTFEGVDCRDVAVQPGTGGKAFYLADSLIRDYALGTPYDVSSGVNTGNSYSFSSQTSFARGFFVRSDGKKVYVASISTIYEYDFLVGWETSAGSYNSKSYTLDVAGAQDITFESNGLTMYVANATTNRIEQYALGEAWDIPTLSYTGYYKDISGISANVFGISMANSDNSLYLGDGTADTIYQLDR